MAVPPNTGALEQQANSYKGGLRQRAPDRGVLQRYGLEESDGFVRC